MQRILRVDPSAYRTETLLASAGAWSDSDIGKPVKLSGDNVDLCASGEEIYGFIMSVEPYTQDGDDVAGVACDVNQEAEVADEAGTLTVGTLVEAGTATAVATATPTNGANVIAVADATLAVDKWRVVALYSTGAGRKILIRKI